MSTPARPQQPLVAPGQTAQDRLSTDPAAPSRPSLGERWVICRAGHVHWGANGAAGLLLSCLTGPQPLYLLARRSRWVDEGGKWGIPGGAIRTGESPGQAARREFEEEVGGLTDHRVTGFDRQDCGGGWAFWTICGCVQDTFDAYCLKDTDATGWFTASQARWLDLHHGLRRFIDENLHRRPAAGR